MNLRKLAKGKECMVRVPGYCSGDPHTTVLAHYRLGTGRGQKPDDFQGAWACYRYHMAVDGQLKTTYTRDQLRLWHAEGVFRTQRAVLNMGFFNSRDQGER